MPERIISADDHIDMCYLPRDLWQRRVPSRFKERAPAVVDLPQGPMWVREDAPWGVWGSKRADGRRVPFDLAGLSEEPQPGIWRPTTPKYRLEDMGRDGIDAQVIYNFLNWSFADQQLKSACIEAYNSWLAEDFCSAAPDRLIGLATLPGHDARAAVRELHRVIGLGLLGAIFDVFGAAKPIFDPSWEPLWAAAAEAGIPISVHIGGGHHLVHKVPAEARWRRAALSAIGCFQLDEVLAVVLLGGMLERHPRLKFVLGESGIGWIPFVLERLGFEAESFRTSGSGALLETEPGELFRRQVFVTFSHDPHAAELITEIGPDNVMWASDYPHGDGTFPHSSTIIARTFATVDRDIKAKVLGGNARALYRIA